MGVTAIARNRRGAPTIAVRCTHADDLLTLAEVLMKLKVSRSTWNDWRAKNRAPRCTKLPNGTLRVRRSVLDQWLEDQEEH